MIPTFNFPAIFLERIIRSDLPVNLQALACRVESSAEGSQNLLIAESQLDTALTPPFNSASLELNDSNHENSILSIRGEFKEKYSKATFGPLSPATSELNSNWGVFGKVCNLDKPCLVDEVHLRRFDGLLVTISPTLKFILGSHFFPLCC